jgi:hypothetical protein
VQAHSASYQGDYVTKSIPFKRVTCSGMQRVPVQPVCPKTPTPRILHTTDTVDQGAVSTPPPWADVGTGRGRGPASASGEATARAALGWLWKVRRDLAIGRRLGSGPRGCGPIAPSITSLALASWPMRARFALQARPARAPPPGHGNSLSRAQRSDEYFHQTGCAISMPVRMNRDYLNHVLSKQTKDYRQGRAVLRVDDPENTSFATSPKAELLERRTASAGLRGWATVTIFGILTITRSRHSYASASITS